MLPFGRGRAIRSVAPSRHQRVGAYSLVQLLVIVAVAAILLALLMPAYQAAVESVRKSICMGNLRQNGLAYLAYAQDHQGAYPPTPNGSYPQCFYNNGDYNIPTYYVYLLQGNYVSFTTSLYGTTNYTIIPSFFCPSFLNNTRCTPGKAFNIYLSGGYAVWVFPAWVGIYHSVQRVSDNPRRVIMGDAVVAGYNFNHIGYTHGAPTATADGANWIYVDQHVEWVPMAQLTVTQGLGGGTYYLPATP